MPVITTVLFDLDGTLVDSRADLVAAVNHALVSVGWGKKEGRNIIPHVGNGLRQLLSNVFENADDATLDKATTAFQDYYDVHCVDETVLYGDVLTGLTHLSARGKIGVVTNKPRHFAEKILKQLGVAAAITTVMGGDTFPERKPHPRPVLEAMKTLGGQAGSTLMVGDGLQDIKAGQAAGIKTCAARYGYGFLPETLALKPDYVINTFNELKEIVK